MTGPITLTLLSIYKKRARFARYLAQFLFQILFLYFIIYITQTVAAFVNILLIKT